MRVKIDLESRAIGKFKVAPNYLCVLGIIKKIAYLPNDTDIDRAHCVILVKVPPTLCITTLPLCVANIDEINIRKIKLYEAGDYISCWVGLTCCEDTGQLSVTIVDIYDHTQDELKMAIESTFEMFDKAREDMEEQWKKVLNAKEQRN